MSSKRGPILIAEEDIDDRDVLRDVFKNLGVRNELKFFDNGQQMLDYLLTTNDMPFLILSDVNLPLMSGLALREKINATPSLRHKSIPFIFLTTNMEKEYVERAYEMMVQGYFMKQDSLQEITATIKMIIDYWNVCHHPNRAQYG